VRHFFSVILLHFWLCASVITLGHCVVAAEVGCNGIFEILIYTPYEKRREEKDHVVSRKRMAQGALSSLFISPSTFPSSCS
jgi:hypothetical protein